jgi:hypothetical protein
LRHRKLGLGKAEGFAGGAEGGGGHLMTSIFDPDFGDYRAALAYVCDKLKITNGDKIPVVYDLGGLFP